MSRLIKYTIKLTHIIRLSKKLYFKNKFDIFKKMIAEKHGVQLMKS